MMMITTFPMFHNDANFTLIKLAKHIFVFHTMYMYKKDGYKIIISSEFIFPNQL